MNISDYFRPDPEIILKKLADLADNYHIDDFISNPEIVGHPGFSILARQDGMVQNAMKKQGLGFGSLEGIIGQQISSRQSFVGSLSSALSSVGGVRTLNA